ncbi:uncharacterized protein LOC18428986 isoform X2 [Amborella trichopoda]|uniref:Uncharacterized protein n=1 Tax=Amborella trichopoda TaxID=13333 RepID=W1NZ38_AMBTC|nr:uncharacterized protein LOC18428986 isoform X2 [Amborella trichopoda]ERN00913.1 hypothetical protein AMTR_s00103p00157960 [Amborella trichopoda]|eukprot:XP_020519759.1 uncharacterized protein LOC18428986 isoform X2 [Amborella trichopoda]
MEATKESLVSRLDRLDILISYLEELKGSESGKSSCVSTSRSGTTSNGHSTSVGSSPPILEKRCRPLDTVSVETQVKGTLVDRLVLVEGRVLQLEKWIEDERKEKEEERGRGRRPPKRGLKRFVEGCIGVKAKSRD